MNRTIIGTTIALMAALAISCSETTIGDPPVDEPKEFVAKASDFTGYAGWTLSAGPIKGPDPAGRVGNAHGSRDSTTRTIRRNRADAAVDTSGNYPVGTIFLKEVARDGAVAEITAMVKRGGNFNSSGGGWEYFTLNNGAIVSRGVEIDQNRCVICHGHAPTGRDHIFSYP